MELRGFQINYVHRSLHLPLMVVKVILCQSKKNNLFSIQSHINNNKKIAPIRGRWHSQRYPWRSPRIAILYWRKHSRTKKNLCFDYKWGFTKISITLNSSLLLLLSLVTLKSSYAKNFIASKEEIWHVHGSLTANSEGKGIFSLFSVAHTSFAYIFGRKCQRQGYPTHTQCFLIQPKCYCKPTKNHMALPPFL